ncbi:MAG: hypothetical protein IPJ71_10665 [Bdellovibrionales bacterium]|nr:hypothetical protein [Bdellovibrionales bacterium]
MDTKIKHLEMIQVVVNRMAGNSFLIKGWAVTLVSAIFALAASGSKFEFILICYFALPIFWMLDSYYLHQERAYRGLYESVRTKKESEVDFSMGASAFESGQNSWASSLFSKTLLIFYGGTIAIVVLVMFWMRH